MSTNIQTTARSTALDRPSEFEPWKRADWQRLWLASHNTAKPWRSLALVPAAPGAPPELTLHIAVTLAHTGMVHLGAPIHVADATRLSLGELVPFSEEIGRYTAETGGMILIALPPINDNVTAVSLAQGADRCLLCVLLGKMSIADSKKTLAKIGQPRFVGSVVLREGDLPK
ncbi:MAG: hypothetical protein ABW252_18340 [Polyangiales bacterium]